MKKLTAWILLVVTIICILASCQKSRPEPDFNTVDLSDSEYNTGEIYYVRSYPENRDFTEAYYEYVNNEILVIANEGVAKSEVEELAESYGASVVGYIELTGDYQWRFDKTYTYDELLDLTKKLENEEILYASHLQTVLTNEEEGTSGFVKYKDNWGYEAIKADKAAEYVKDAEAIHLGAIDASFAKDHEDIEYAELLSNTEPTYNEHGNHVMGIMGATRDNGLGINGVYPLAKGNLYGFSTGDLDCTMFIYKAALTALLTRNVKVINVSLGIDDASTVYCLMQKYPDVTADIQYQVDILEEYFLSMLEKGYDFVIVNASGNNACFTFTQNEDEIEDVYYGWSYESSDERVTNGQANYGHPFVMIDNEDVRSRIISVGAVEKTEEGYKEAVFSDNGSRVDLMAPGVEIYSATHKPKKYATFEGTSMAAPHVTGAAACVWSVKPSLTGAQVKEILCSTADIDVEGTDVNMVNVLAAVKKAME
ncbi:MAG: S8 family serine peptidase [Clostridia bacterium]|nr:S8 family serine peptidase [Clostridia bacterium]